MFWQDCGCNRSQPDEAPPTVLTLSSPLSGTESSQTTACLRLVSRAVESVCLSGTSMSPLAARAILPDGITHQLGSDGTNVQLPVSQLNGDHFHRDSLML